MQEERLIELLIELHLNTPRQGPGEADSTLRALAMCDGLPPRPDILDVGCGSGAQSVDLARATGGRVTAVDFCAQFLDQLRDRLKGSPLEGRITPLRADMAALPLPADAFDLVWSEGAIYSMGFDNGLAKWRTHLRPGGWLAVSEVSWLTPDTPDELRRHWTQWYPGIRSVDANIAAIRGLGYEPAGHFTIPVRAWTEEYYAPLAPNLEAFRAKYANDPEGMEVVDMTLTEMRLNAAYNRHYGYEFYVMRRRD
jgi:SAM-dependent methyltransferase